MCVCVLKGLKTDQLQASLAGEDDGGGVVLCGVRRTRSGALVGDGHFACFAVELWAVGTPSDVL